MATVLMTLNAAERGFGCLKPFCTRTTKRVARICYDMFAYHSESLRAYTVQCHIEAG